MTNALRILLAISAFCLPLVFANPGISGEQKSDLSQIIEIIKSLPEKQGQTLADQLSLIDSKVKNLDLNDNSIEREKFTNMLIDMLLSGTSRNKSFATRIIGNLPYNSPKLLQALDEALLKSMKCNDPDSCVFRSSSLLEHICITLHKKDPDHIRPRCEKEIGWRLPLE